MDQKRALIVIGAVILILMAIVLGVAYFSGQAARRPLPTITPAPDSISVNQPGRSPLPVFGTPAPIVSSTPTPAPIVAATPVPAVGGVASDTQTYAGTGFTLNYPASWGILTCSNSSNVEFDPTNNSDQLGVACDRAVKPVTLVITNQTATACTGDTITLGNNQVVKSIQNRQSGAVWYKWCVNSSDGKHLEFTHRVSNTSTQATSQQDYASQVENIISSLRFGTSS